jgi:hypothetical protein
MPSDVTAGTLASYARALDHDGYVVVPGALDPATVARLCVAFDAAPAQSDGTQHVAVTEETPDRDLWLGLREHPVVTSAAAHVFGGAPFRTADPHGRNPLRGFGQQGLHADAAPRASAAPFGVVTALFMLDDFAADNGATRVVPGTHRRTAPPAREMAQPASRHPDERVVTGPAGAVLVFNGHLWHAGRRNDSGRPRRAAQMVIRRA